jgi:hypothetical protein
MLNKERVKTIMKKKLFISKTSKNNY